MDGKDTWHGKNHHAKTECDWWNIPWITLRASNLNMQPKHDHITARNIIGHAIHGQTVACFNQKKGQRAKWRWLCQYQLAPYGIAYSSRWDVAILIIVWSYLIFACQRRTPPTFNSLKNIIPFSETRKQKHILRGWAPSYWNRQLPFNWAKGCFSCGATMASRALMSASMPVAGRLVDFSFKKSYLWLTPYASFPMGTLLFKPSVICKVYKSTNMHKAHATV